MDDISDELLWWLNDFETTKFLEIRHTPQTRRRVEEYLLERLSRPECPHFGIYDRDGTRLVGTTTVNLLNLRYLTADVSIVVGHPEAGGKGYGTEAVHAVCVYLFRVAGLFKLTSGLYDENHGSRRIFEKNGFTLEGVIRKQCFDTEGKRVDLRKYGLLAEEFTPNFTWMGGESIKIVPAPQL